MKHKVNKRTLGRVKSHRTQMWRNMASSLFEHGHVTTTAAKAKELKKFVEPLFTKGLADSGSLTWQRVAVREMGDRKRAKTLIDLFKENDQQLSGQLRTTRMGERSSDRAPMVKVELILK